MAAQVFVVDSSDARPGKGSELREVLAGLVEVVAAEEAEPLAYGVYFDDAGTRMTVVQVHPSSESMERHLELAPLFRGLDELLTLNRVDVDGTPSDELIRRLREQAQRLGDGTRVSVHALHAGFARIPAPAGSGAVES